MKDETPYAPHIFIMLILLFLVVNRKVNDISGSEVTVEQGFSTSLTNTTAVVR